jgi:hypothetical protein
MLKVSIVVSFSFKLLCPVCPSSSAENLRIVIASDTTGILNIARTTLQNGIIV